jgi:hypothetical protein
MMCPKCKGTGWLLYQKDAPSPPYKEGKKLEFGVRCDCTNDSAAKQTSENGFYQ